MLLVSNIPLMLFWLLFGQFCSVEKGRILYDLDKKKVIIVLIYKLSTHKISASGLFRKFQPRYSLTDSYKKERVYRFMQLAERYFCLASLTHAQHCLCTPEPNINNIYMLLIQEQAYPHIITQHRRVNSVNKVRTQLQICYCIRLKT